MPMRSTRQGERLALWSAFEFDLGTLGLRKHGIRLRIEQKPAQILARLLEEPGQVVGRDELVNLLWPGEQHGDFDQRLNKAIYKVRCSLGDDPANPRFVQTLSCNGYRFIADVEFVSRNGRSASVLAPNDAGQKENQPLPEQFDHSGQREGLVWVEPQRSTVYTSDIMHGDQAGTVTRSGLDRVSLSRLFFGGRAWRIVSILIIAAIPLVVWTIHRMPAPQPVIRFTIAPPENASVAAGEASISPDGHMLAFLARSGTDKVPVLWVRPLDSLTAEPIPGTEGARWPFWSPDSQEIGYSGEGNLEKVAVAGGMPQTICHLVGPAAAATWSRDGVILFSTLQGSLYRVLDTGGTPTLIAAPDPVRHEGGYSFPQFLPDGRHFLFLFHETSGVSGEYRVEAGSLDSKSVKDLAQVTSYALYAPPGYLLYMDQNALMARPFDLRALDFTGPARVAENVAADRGYGNFSVSATGVLTYSAWLSEAIDQMAWFNRAGLELGTLGPPGRYIDPALSPDGTRVAVGAAINGKRDVWVFDTKRGTASRLTFEPANSANPAWTADGSRILFTSYHDGHRGIFQKDANGLGGTQMVYESKDQPTALNDLSADGRYAIYDNGGSSDSKQLWVLPLFGERKPFVSVQGAFGALSAQFSPNGRYVAYASNETGRLEIYVQTFPEPTGKWQVSTSGGAEPMWRRDGKELFYLTLDQKLMAVDVNTTAPGFGVGIPKELFQAHLVPLSGWRNLYVASPDGQRFLMIVPANEAEPAPITVVANWPALLRK